MKGSFCRGVVVQVCGRVRCASIKSGAEAHTSAKSNHNGEGVSLARGVYNDSGGNVIGCSCRRPPQGGNRGIRVIQTTSCGIGGVFKRNEPSRKAILSVLCTVLSWYLCSQLQFLITSVRSINNTLLRLFRFVSYRLARAELLFMRSCRPHPLPVPLPPPCPERPGSAWGGAPRGRTPSAAPASRHSPCSRCAEFP